MALDRGIKFTDDFVAIAAKMPGFQGMNRLPKFHFAAVAWAVAFGVSQICGAQAAAARAPGAQDSYQQQLGIARAEADRGEISAARADIELAIAADAGRSGGWYQLGLLLGQTGDFHGAEAALRKAIELQPDLAAAHFSLALTVIADPQDNADWAVATAECRQALKYRPDYPEALNLLGVGLVKSGLTQDAIPNFERAIKLSPSMAEAHFNLGMALEGTDRLAEAELEYRAAIAAKATYPEADNWLSKLLLREGKLAEAERESLVALRANPDLAEAHYTLARILARVPRPLHRESEAKWELAEFKDLTQRQPDGIQSATLSNQGLELARKGETADGVASLKKSIALKPDYGAAHYNLGLVLAASGNISGAIPELKKAVSLLPGEARPWFDLGRVLRLAGQDGEALSALSWASRLAPTDAAVAAALKSLRERVAEPRRSGGPAVENGPAAAWQSPKQRAEVIQRPGVGAATDTASGHFAFAAELKSGGDFQGAAGELLRSLALKPAMTEARHALACAYLDSGDEEHAMLEYYKLFRYGPESPASRDALRRLFLGQEGEGGGGRRSDLASLCRAGARPGRRAAGGVTEKLFLDGAASMPAVRLPIGYIEIPINR